VTGGRFAAADIAEQRNILGSVIARNASELGSARDAIAGARIVRFAAIGSSKHAAGYGAAALDVCGGIPSMVLPAPGSGVDLPSLRPDEPVVIVSQSGHTPALIDLAGRVSSAGAAVIAVTNEPDSPLGSAASITLHCHAGAERIVAATKSVTAQCLLLRALAGDVAEHELESLDLAVSGVLSLDVASIVHDDAPQSVVAAGFAAEWIADEIALKFIEMCGIPVTSESVVDHFHGPVAGVRSVVAFLDPNDPNSAELARRDGVTTVGPGAAFDLTTPSSGDASLDAIVALIVGQRIAAAWAVRLGTDPDSDRGLTKVTRTR
jgi:glutamine---fructose-6-phosphate transaminase (isomerizing)